MITQRELHSLLDYNPDSGLWRWKVGGKGRKFGWFAGTPRHGYFIISIGGRDNRRNYYTHRLAWFYVHGEWPLEVDHINRVTSDTRISNLRAADKSTNAINSVRRRGLGVFYDARYSKPWRAYVVKNRVQIEERFSSKEEAISWRREKEKEIFGEFLPC